jgi:asparagine synthase (glutamine-hydrolysing)
MNNAISHRGPDDEGYYIDEQVALGHRRLAIIDLSPAGTSAYAK